MNNNYRYGSEIVSVAPANGVEGVLIRSTGDRFIFRVYHAHDKTQFTDYDIRHDDLTVTIAENELAAFYKIGEDKILDHSPEVLGLERE